MLDTGERRAVSRNFPTADKGEFHRRPDRSKTMDRELPSMKFNFSGTSMTLAVIVLRGISFRVTNIVSLVIEIGRILRFDDSIIL